MDLKLNTASALANPVLTKRTVPKLEWGMSLQPDTVKSQRTGLIHPASGITNWVYTGVER